MTFDLVNTTRGFDSKRGIRKGSFIRLFSTSISSWGGCQTVPIYFATFFGNLVPSSFLNSSTSSILIFTGFNYLHWRFSLALAAGFFIFKSFICIGSIVIYASLFEMGVSSIFSCWVVKKLRTIDLISFTLFTLLTRWLPNKRVID